MMPMGYDWKDVIYCLLAVVAIVVFLNVWACDRDNHDPQEPGGMW